MGINSAAAAAAKSGSSSTTFLLLIVLVFVGFYFLLIRPQRRRQQQTAQQQNTVTPGARVRTTAGMYATVVSVDDNDVVLEVAPGVEVRYLKRAIMEVISSDEAEAEETDETEEDGDEKGTFSDADTFSENGDATHASAEDELTDAHENGSREAKAKSDTEAF